MKNMYKKYPAFFIHIVSHRFAAVIKDNTYSSQRCDHDRHRFVCAFCPITGSVSVIQSIIIKDGVGLKWL